MLEIVCIVAVQHVFFLCVCVFFQNKVKIAQIWSMNQYSGFTTGWVQSIMLNTMKNNFSSSLERKIQGYGKALAVELNVPTLEDLTAEM